MIFAQMAFLGYTRVYPCRFCMFLRGQDFLSHTQMGGRRSQNRRSDVRSVGRVGLWPLPRFEPISKASRWNPMAFPNRFRRPLSCWDSWWVAGCFSLQLGRCEGEDCHLTPRISHEEKTPQFSMAKTRVSCQFTCKPIPWTRWLEMSHMSLGLSCRTYRTRFRSLRKVQPSWSPRTAMANWFEQWVSENGGI